jgi:hypothetical protein
VTSPQLGTGRLTPTGAVEFLSHEVSHPTPHTCPSTRRSRVAGCAAACATASLASLHTYQGLKLAEGGSTPADDLAVAKPFRFDADPHGGGC